MALTLPGTGSMLIPTGSTMSASPALFDNSLALASTAFVQQANGNMAGYVAYSTTTTLTAADVGKYVYASGATMTLTLPNATLVPAGSRLYIQASSGTTLTVTSPNGNMSGPNSSSAVVPSLVMAPAVSCEFISNGTGWMATGGSGFSNLQGSGYQKLPSGLIIQWGNATGTTGNLAAGYPIAFPTAVCQVVATLSDKTAGTINGITLVITGASLASKTTVTIIPGGTDGLGTTTAHYIAIGY